MTTTINGTTGIDKVQDGSIVQSDLAANVVGNGPAFRAYKNAAQSITTTPSKLIYQVEEFDTNNAYDPATSRFQPNVPGYYLISAAYQTVVTTAAPLIRLVKNGMDYAYSVFANISQATPIVTVNTLVYLNGAGDYVEIHASQGTTGDTTAGGTGCYFSGVLVRAA